MTPEPSTASHLSLADLEGKRLRPPSLWLHDDLPRHVRVKAAIIIESAGITCILGLYSLHRLSFVQEPAGPGGRLLVLRDLLLEACRSVHSLSSAAGLLRIAQMPQWFLRSGWISRDDRTVLDPG